jgi:hypothetical protein
VFTGLPGLHSNVLKGCWKNIANNLRLQIIEQLGKEVISDNVSIKMTLSLLDKMMEHKNISACRYCHWDKCSSGRRYNLIYGCSMMIGC